jgi:hypothetical protein
MDTTSRYNRQLAESIELQARAMRQELLSRLFADAVMALLRACRTLVTGRRQTRAA